MKRCTYLVGVAVVGCFCLVAAPAAAAPHNWGQEVKNCNLTPGCYPGGTQRGAYVSGQAADGDGPGYAWEIHNLAKPGNSNPTLR